MKYVLRMTKRLLTSTLLVVCLLMLPMGLQASPSEMFGVEQIGDKSDVQISVSQSVVHITGAEGQVMEIISLTGRHVMSVPTIHI